MLVVPRHFPRSPRFPQHTRGCRASEGLRQRGAAGWRRRRRRAQVPRASRPDAVVREALRRQRCRRRPCIPARRRNASASASLRDRDPVQQPLAERLSRQGAATARVEGQNGTSSARRCACDQQKHGCRSHHDGGAATLLCERAAHSGTRLWASHAAALLHTIG